MKTVLLFCVGGVLGGLLGLAVGAFVGGNLATDVRLFGLRGYEGTGLLGLVLGSAAGGLGAVFLTRRRIGGPVG